MQLVIQAVALYLLLLVALRIASSRVSRSVTTIDMVLTLVLGGIAFQAVMQDDASIAAAVVALLAFALTHALVSVSKRRWPGVARAVEGPPVILFSDGQWHQAVMRHFHIQKLDVLAQMRSKDMRNLDGVEMAVLEHNGAISLIEKTQASTARGTASACPR